MHARRDRNWFSNPERGVTLFMVAVSLIVLLGICALAIDLASLYVGRSEAQRAADAAALAGAKKFIESGFLSGLVPPSTAENLARQEAISVGGQNLVGDQAAQILDGDVTFDFSQPENPRIAVTVQRVAARGNPMPTFFAKVLGFLEVDVAATATAEAYSSSGGPLPIGAACVKPWILPNCDPEASHGGPASPYCSGTTFVHESTGTIVNPGAYPAGVIGQYLLLKPGDPSAAAAPSQFYPIQIPPGDEPALCPDCAGSGGGGGALYRRNISCCNTNPLVCGQNVDVDLATGNMVGPTQQGVQCLIHQLPNGTGQDTLDTSTVPFQITGGDNNPNPALRDQIISSSDSLVTVPLYDGHPLCPGGSCGFTVNIIGFLQVFTRQVGPPQATVDAYVLNVAGCGAGGSGGGGGSGSGGGPVFGPGGGLFPVRLVRPGN